jgi:putative transposase
MSEYLRRYVPGGQYFFTLITERRQPILTDKLARDCLRNAIKEVQIKRPFKIEAIVLLPDHFHTIWSLPEGDSDYSNRMMRIKAIFTKAYLLNDGFEAKASDSKKECRERGVWQRRFWEHTIQNETDFKRHYHYIHYNPVKHGHVKCVKDWLYSSFHEAVKKGYYPENWGCADYGKPIEIDDLDCE